MNHAEPAKLSGRSFPWRVMAAGSILLLELSVLIPWVRLLTAGDGLAPAGIMLVWFFGIGWLARMIVRAGERRSLRPDLVMVASAFGLVVSISLTLSLFLPSERPLALAGGLTDGFRPGSALAALARGAPLILAVILVWRRGHVAASPGILNAGWTGLKFRVGVVIFAILAIFTSRSGPGAIPPLLPVFLLASLLAMSLTRAHRLSSRQGAGEPPFTEQWLAGLLGLFAITVTVGLLAAWGLNTSMAIQILVALRTGLVQLIYLLTLPFLMLLEPLIIRFVLRFQQILSMFAENEQEYQFLVPGRQHILPSELPPIFVMIRGWLGLLEPIWPYVRSAVTLLILGLLMLWAVRSASDRSREKWEWMSSPDEGQDLTEEGSGRRVRRALGALGRDLIDLGRNVIRRQPRTALFVRRVYARLLALAAEQGRSRHPSETPLEFEGILADLFPSCPAEIDLITRSYVQVRYGLLPETEEKLEEVRTAWRRLQESVG